MTLCLRPLMRTRFSPRAAGGDMLCCPLVSNATRAVAGATVYGIPDQDETCTLGCSRHTGRKSLMPFLITIAEGRHKTAWDCSTQKRAASAHVQTQRAGKARLGRT